MSILKSQTYWVSGLTASEAVAADAVFKTAAAAVFKTAAAAAVFKTAAAASLEHLPLMLYLNQHRLE